VAYSTTLPDRRVVFRVCSTPLPSSCRGFALESAAPTRLFAV
jgi:hypothetical protein